jgi:Phytanoyl-CoA dioxygenase (PhyH)
MSAILTPNDLNFFHEHGYVVVPNIVPQENCDAVIDALWTFLEMDRDNPDDWYRPPLKRGGMLEMYQHQAMWDNRQHPRMHRVFSELFGTEKLLVSVDRVNMNPPVREDKPEYDHKGMMHWDTDVTYAATAPLRVQGVLYLADTTEETGGFCCAPGHQNTVREWAKTVTPGSGERPDMSDITLKPIVAPAGSLVIWDTLLYHGNGRNVSGKPRLAQYISMWPAPDVPLTEAQEASRQDRIRRWQERLHPDAPWAPGDPRAWEPTHGKTAELSQLGRKLLGLDLWKNTAV